MPIYSFEGRRPEIDGSAYISPTATVIGGVSVGERCYIGHGAILRGDYGSIAVGDETAVEEGVIVHARPEDWTRIGRRVTIGHGAMVHNATIDDGAVIGMRAVVSDFAVVGQGAIVGEMTLVKNSQAIPAGKVAVGVPARVVGDVDEHHRPMTRWAKDLYVELSARYPAGLVELPQPDPPVTALPPLVPIGVIRSPYREIGPPQGAMADAEGEVELEPRYEEGLADVAGFSHVILLFGLHRSRGYRLTVTPHMDPAPRGLFATRSPRRPNPIGMTVVRLLGVEGCRLRVRGVDMLDGTPLLDIKPYVPRFDGPSDARAGWLEAVLDRHQHDFSP
jgi:tRNA-Thr(GGU) m(6)t(6)A37 methyltransferase TsaA